MGVGGGFWEILKPYARNENFDFLQNKKVAVDLSYWIVQHETALKNKARNPHLRLTFFRTINLFSKLGAFPVFVTDGTPSPLKARARMERFYRLTGLDVRKVEDGVSVERNRAFQKCVRECVELLELLGIPVLKARCEAEELCAQLNSEGHVDACITADSDAFLYGAKCVIKCLRPSSKEPFECYYMSDLEAGLGLKQVHLVAISLLVGNDHDLGGVSGIGIETALRFVRMFPEEEILNRLHDIGNGDIPLFQIDSRSVGDCDLPNPNENSPKTKSPHCSYCGHPGSKRAHSKVACEHCVTSGKENCTQKPRGLNVDAPLALWKSKYLFPFQFTPYLFLTYNKTSVLIGQDRKIKEQKKHENWQLGVCRKISTEKNFPNDEIIEMYLKHKRGTFTDVEIPSLLWEEPKIESLIDFLGYHQHWDPSYIRQRMLPLLSTNYLRKMASNPTENLLLHGQYEFDSIQRVKIRYGQPCYLVTWRKNSPALGNVSYNIEPEQFDVQDEDVLELSEANDLLDEPDVPQILVDAGCSFLLTEENMELVRAAFPGKVEKYLHEKEIKELKSRKKKSSKKSEGEHDKFESPKSRGIQLSITEFYRSTKTFVQAKQEEDSAKLPENPQKGHAKEKRRMATANLSKSVRRRLLFD
ncbi:hypothetical protein IFM89_035070 [Coptis chinensis]|uniref:Flap endonuclease GEN-like 1 n=1 Tax=Coptis chinensis TaxID=261450 RepID=A0A835IK96_9MAGN|nr:hypothetical protein IFM89_035070 [Coptis chinensis]